LLTFAEVSLLKRNIMRKIHHKETLDMDDDEKLFRYGRWALVLIVFIALKIHASDITIDFDTIVSYAKGIAFVAVNLLCWYGFCMQAEEKRKANESSNIPTSEDSKCPISVTPAVNREEEKKHQKEQERQLKKEAERALKEQQKREKALAEKTERERKKREKEAKEKADKERSRQEKLAAEKREQERKAAEEKRRKEAEKKRKEEEERKLEAERKKKRDRERRRREEEERRRQHEELMARLYDEYYRRG